MLHLIQCRYAQPFWGACIQFCQDVIGETRDMSKINQAIVLNIDRKHQLLGENTRAFLRHALQWHYASLTNVLHRGHKYVWQACFHIWLYLIQNERKSPKLRF